ncbi:MAG TPA: hypothetical protein VE197_22720 [Mycobacterium sp.]|jgi:hypothetical protein|nr:hypothetical protein [Mycobacterium sp.]
MRAIDQLERALLVVAGNVENAAKAGATEEARDWTEMSQMLAQAVATVRSAYVSPRARGGLKKLWTG